LELMHQGNREDLTDRAEKYLSVCLSTTTELGTKCTPSAPSWQGTEITHGQ
jgi:hypothetical protein